MTPDALWVERLSVSLGETGRSVRVHADGLRVAAGELVALTGASGSGKTLLLECLGLLRRPDPGARFGLDDGTDLAAAWEGAGDPAALRRDRFGFVPQSGGLLNFLTLEANIMLAQKLAGRSDPAWGERLIERLGLGARRRAMPDALSLGERQRVAIARALAHRPSVVIADEPTAALDPQMSAEVLVLFADLATEQGTAVLMSTHDVALASVMGLRRHTLVVGAAGSGSGVESRLAAAPGVEP